MRFEFATAQRIIFGPGSVREAGRLARELGRRALVVRGRDPSRSDFLLEGLRQGGVSPIGFSVTAEPDLEVVENGVSLAVKENCDFVIAIGGGSAIDGGKAIAAMLANPGKLLDYMEIIGGGQPLLKPSAPFIAIPTTAGTGSEATRNAVLASRVHRVKASLRSPFMLPRMALIDPELTYALPPAITASTGLDALTQLIEPFVCARPQPVTDALCTEGMRRVARSLRAAFSDGQDAAAREDMALASLFGGIALANAGLGAVHGFAGPIGGLFDAPHGAICAALLPHVMEANIRALRERAPTHEALPRYETAARILTGNPAATADQGVEWVRQLAADLRVLPLSAYGLTAANSSEVVEKAARASSMKANPIVLSPAELAGILQNSLP